LLQRHSVTLLGVARSGKSFKDRVRLLPIKAGDVLLLLGRSENVTAAAEWLGVLPLEGRETEVVQRSKAGMSIGVFLLAVILAVAGSYCLARQLDSACRSLRAFRRRRPNRQSNRHAYVRLPSVGVVSRAHDCDDDPFRLFEQRSHNIDCSADIDVAITGALAYHSS